MGVCEGVDVREGNIVGVNVDVWVGGRVGLRVSVARGVGIFTDRSSFDVAFCMILISCKYHPSCVPLPSE